MEERLTDEPIKLDGLDDLPDPEPVPDGEADEVDEDLVGLTPSRLQEELAKRKAAEEKARREYEKLLEQAEEKRKAGLFSEAEPLYLQAVQYDAAASEGLWAARTEEYTSLERLYQNKIAEELSDWPAAWKTVVSRMDGAMRTELGEYEKEAVPLREEVSAGMEKRRDAFLANRNYWLPRFLISCAVFLGMGIACIVAATFIVRTRGLAAPVVTAVFGGLALLSLAAVFLLARKLFVAQKLLSDNEKLSSTEKGSRLAELEKRISVLRFVLEGPQQEAEPEYGGQDGTEPADEEAPLA